jgi:hypothetical protein
MKSSPLRSKEVAERSPSTLMPEAEPPITFSATSSSALVEVAAKVGADVVAEVGMAFHFLLTVLGPPALFLYLYYTTAVVFLAATFFALSSIDYKTFTRSLCSS